MWVRIAYLAGAPPKRELGARESDSGEEGGLHQGASLRLCLQTVGLISPGPPAEGSEGLWELPVEDQKAGALSPGYRPPLVEGLSPGVMW